MLACGHIHMLSKWNACKLLPFGSYCVTSSEVNEACYCPPESSSLHLSSYRNKHCFQYKVIKQFDCILCRLTHAQRHKNSVALYIQKLLFVPLPLVCFPIIFPCPWEPLYEKCPPAHIFQFILKSSWNNSFCISLKLYHITRLTKILSRLYSYSFVFFLKKIVLVWQIFFTIFSYT